MAKRKIFAIISVDDDKAIEEGKGTGEYLEREFGWLEQSGISLNEWLLAEEDSEDMWERYMNYLFKWAFEHSGDEETAESPLSFNVWKARNVR